jgi:hypothetical protein
MDFNWEVQEYVDRHQKHISHHRASYISFPRNFVDMFEQGFQPYVQTKTNEPIIIVNSSNPPLRVSSQYYLPVRASSLDIT